MPFVQPTVNTTNDFSAVFTDSSTDATPVLPSHVAGDILVVAVAQKTATSVLSIPSLSVANGFVAVGATYFSASSWVAMFWKRCTSGSESAPTVAENDFFESGFSQTVAAWTINKCRATGDPYEVFDGNQDEGTAVSIPGATSLTANVLTFWAFSDADMGSVGGASNPSGGTTFIGEIGHNRNIGGAAGEGHLETFGYGKAAAGAYGSLDFTFTPTSGVPVNSWTGMQAAFVGVEQFTLTVALAGSGTGTVTSAPPGISLPGDGTQDYDSGTVVTLTGTPTGGSTFTSWSGDGVGVAPADRVVTMNANKSITATFTAPATESTTGSKFNRLLNGLFNGGFN